MARSEKREVELAARGSQRWLQVAIDRAPEHLDAPVRTALGLPAGVRIEWLSPIRKDGFAEYRDMAALRKVGAPGLATRSLADFWPQRGPVWDALGRTSNDQLLFVEAKAHIAEMASPGCQAAGDSRVHIERSLEEARQHFAPRATACWSETFYQYANRLAFHYLVRHLNNLPGHLLFIYFVSAPDVPVSASEPEWHGAIQLMHAALGLRPTGIDSYVHEVFVDTAPLVSAAAATGR